MPIRQRAILASRASTCPRDHFCRSATAPRPSRPTTWTEFLPISISIAAIIPYRISVMVCSFHLAPPASLRADRGQEHGRTIPLADSGGHRLFGGAAYNMLQSSIGGRSECRNKLHDVVSLLSWLLT